MFTADPAAGSSWREIPASVTAMVAAADVIVAVGVDKDCLPVGLRSDDGGSSWATSQQPVGFTPTRVLGAQEGSWIAADSDQTWISADGLAWAPVEANVGAIGQLADGTIVGVGAGRVSLSDNLGGAWTDIGFVSPLDAVQFAVADRRIVAGSEAGLYLMTIADGDVSSAKLADGRIAGVSHGDSLFVALAIESDRYAVEILGDTGWRSSMPIDPPDVAPGLSGNGAIAATNDSIVIALCDPASSETVYVYRLGFGN